MLFDVIFNLNFPSFDATLVCKTNIPVMLTNRLGKKKRLLTKFNETHFDDV
jgi:hypothetical protein